MSIRAKLQGERFVIRYDIFEIISGTKAKAELLNEVLYLWDRNGERGFVNFADKSSHKDYRFGESWYERLGLTRSTWESAMYGKDPIGTRITSDLANKAGFDSKRSYIKHLLLTSKSKEHIVLMDGDYEGRTWHFLNVRLLETLLDTEQKKRKEKKSAEFNDYKKSRNYQDDIDSVFEDYDNEFTVNKVENYFVAAQPVREVKSKNKQGQLFQGKYDLMPETFKVLPETLDKCEELGYNILDVLDEAKKFIYYHTEGNGVKKKSQNWQNEFLLMWVPGSYDFGRIRKDGKLKGDKPSQTDIYRNIDSRYQGITD